MNLDQLPMNTGRRAILKGIGASLTLPWLESLAWAAGGARAAQSGPPLRWAFLMMSNGVNANEWWAKQNGSNIELSKTLGPLASLKDEVLFLENMTLYPDKSPSAAHKYFTSFLSGQEYQKGAIGRAGTTLDYVLGRSIGAQTSLPNLTLAIEPPQVRNKADGATANAFTISWSSPTTPVVPEVYPRQAFDRMFNTQMLTQDKSVLDFVLSDAKDVRRKLSGHDQRKLDEYMASVRNVEQRIERLSQPREYGPGDWRPTLDQPNMAPPEDGLDFNLPEHIKLMLDLMVVAFQTDKTRIATFLFASDASYNVRFDFLEGVSGDSLHAISHHNNKPEKLAEHQRINQYHVEQFAYLINRMKGVDEGNGTTLLDNSMLLFGSNMMDGNKHDYTNLPLLLAGRGGGSIRPGRVVRYESDDERRVCNLHLAVAQRMGLDLQSFGNSVMPLPNLS